MPSIGDLANDLARTAYEQRILVAVGSVVLVIALGIVAQRRGWLAAARRHPARTVSVLVIALLVAAPIGWYLGSPIFIRTSLVEPPPTAGAGAPAARSSEATIASTPPAPSVASMAPTAPPPRSPAPSVASEPVASGPVAGGPVVIATGEFEGTDDFHFGRGTATVLEVAPGRYHLRLEDFSVRNGPDLYVYLSPDPDGYATDALEVGTLKATDGSFGYDLPPDVDPSRFRSAIIWCKQFSHLFATATFDAT
jgi:hypothetical protein